MEYPIHSFLSLSSQVADLSSSLSLPSEPPDIRNWFTSYAYESPILDSNDKLGDVDVDSERSASDEESLSVGGCCKGEANFVRNETVNEMDLNPNVVDLSLQEEYSENQHLSKNLDTFCSPSPLSESPDVRKWIASHVYESENEGFLSGNTIVDNEILGPNQPSEVYARNEHSSPEILWAKQPLSKISDCAEVKTRSSPSVSNASDFFEVVCPCLKDETIQSHDAGVIEDRFRLGRSIRVCELATAAPPVSKIAACTSSQLGKNKENERDRRAGDSSTKCGEKVCTKAGDDDDKENENKVKGFIATRNRRGVGAKEETSQERPREMLMKVRYLGKHEKLSCEKNIAVKRKALAETTNTPEYGAVSVTGKWRCPQKSKPCLGLPLKQLRLEQWIHRM